MDMLAGGVVRSGLVGLTIPNKLPAAGQCPSLGVLWSEIRE